nr:hypothetical protein 4 [bacterium]
MANSAVSICSNALVLLGGQAISSFTEGGTESQIAEQLYTTTYHAMLTQTIWHFAVRTEQLVRMVDKPDNGYAYKFQLPSDLLYIVKADVGKYEIYERTLYTNAATVQIEMVYPVEEINLPAYFVKALEYNLASLFAIPLTGNASRAQYYRELYEMELKKARRADASQRPGYTLGDNRVLAVRHV